jgi:hypothetical protein
MPRYYFHIRTAQGALVQDEEGVFLPDIEAASREARLSASSFSIDTKAGGKDYSECYFEIVSADGRDTANVPAFVRQRAPL